MFRDFSGPSCPHDYAVVKHRKLDPGPPSRTYLTRSEWNDDVIRTVGREDNKLRGRHQQLDREARITSDVIGNEQRRLQLNWEKTHKNTVGFKAAHGASRARMLHRSMSEGVKVQDNGMTSPPGLDRSVSHIARPGDRMAYHRALLSAGGKSPDERLLDFRRAQAESSRVSPYQDRREVKKSGSAVRTGYTHPVYKTTTPRWAGTNRSKITTGHIRSDQSPGPYSNGAVTENETIRNLCPKVLGYREVRVRQPSYRMNDMAGTSDDLDVTPRSHQGHQMQPAVTVEPFLPPITPRTHSGRTVYIMEGIASPAPMATTRIRRTTVMIPTGDSIPESSMESTTTPNTYNYVYSGD